MVFGQYRAGSTEDYSAVFIDAASLNSGDSVRVSGIRVGTVAKVSLQPNKTVVVSFDTDRDVALTTGTKAVVRYLNLVGDRYLELSTGRDRPDYFPPVLRSPLSARPRPWIWICCWAALNPSSTALIPRTSTP